MLESRVLSLAEASPAELEAVQPALKRDMLDTVERQLLGITGVAESIGRRSLELAAINKAEGRDALHILLDAGRFDEQDNREAQEAIFRKTLHTALHGETKKGVTLQIPPKVLEPPEIILVPAAPDKLVSIPQETCVLDERGRPYTMNALAKTPSWKTWEHYSLGSLFAQEYFSRMAKAAQSFLGAAVQVPRAQLPGVHARKLPDNIFYSEVMGEPYIVDVDPAENNAVQSGIRMMEKEDTNVQTQHRSSIIDSTYGGLRGPRRNGSSRGRTYRRPR